MITTRDSIVDAERWLAGVPVEGSSALCVIGLGQGYLLDALDQRGWSGRVVALEPDASSSREGLDRPEVRAWRTNGRLTVLTGPAYDGLDRALLSIELTADQPVIVVHPAVARAERDQAVQAARLIGRAWFGARANQEAKRENGGRYLLNTLRNAGTIAAEGDAAALAGVGVGVPAIVVGAGPSLDRNLRDIAAHRDRALVIAADTSLRPLLAAGIHPDLVVALDPTETNARHLTDLPPCPDTYLVAEGSLDPEALAHFAGRTFFFNVSDHHPWPWLRSLGIVRGRLRAWGSVLTTAFDLALIMGCDPILFAGADLAFTDRQPYTRGTTYEEDWRRAEAWGQSVEETWQSAVAGWPDISAPGVDGTSVRTAPHLRSFRDWIAVEAGKATAHTIVNTTGAGILVGDAIAQATLLEVLATRPPLSRALRDGVRTAYAVDPDAARQAASAVARFGASGIRIDASPFQEWIAFCGRESVAEGLAGVFGWETRAAPAATASPAPVAMPADTDHMAIAASAVGISEGHLAHALSQMDRAALASLAKERRPQVIVDTGTTWGVAGLAALAAATPEARLFSAATDDLSRALASSLGLANRVVWQDGTDTAVPPGDLLLLSLCDPRTSGVESARRALDRLAPSGTLVLVDDLGAGARAQLHRAAYPLLEERPDVWLIDRRFVDVTTRLAFLCTHASSWTYDPAEVDSPKREATHRAVADRMAGLLWSAFSPRSVRDIGCGASHWLAALEALGVEKVDGVAGLALESVPQPASRSDLCLCIEVAHRLPPQYHQQLVAACTASADTVVFSSPPPGSLGETPHARPLAYWAARFLDHGYLVEDTLRPLGEQLWGFPSHTAEGCVVFRRSFESAALSGPLAGMRDALVAQARRIEDLYMQGLWWQLTLRPVSTPASAAPMVTAPVSLRLPAARLEAGPDRFRTFRFRTDAARWFVSHHAASMELLEDGVPLTRQKTGEPTHVLPRGAWALSRDEVVLSASDGSDPRSNQHTYELRLPPHVAWAELQPLDAVLSLHL